MLSRAKWAKFLVKDNKNCENCAAPETQSKNYVKLVSRPGHGTYNRDCPGQTGTYGHLVKGKITVLTDWMWADRDVWSHWPLLTDYTLRGRGGVKYWLLAPPRQLQRRESMVYFFLLDFLRKFATNGSEIWPQCVKWSRKRQWRVSSR
jgi:hypothetical protein